MTLPSSSPLLQPWCSFSPLFFFFLHGRCWPCNINQAPIHLNSLLQPQIIPTALKILSNRSFFLLADAAQSNQILQLRSKTRHPWNHVFFTSTSGCEEVHVHRMTTQCHCAIASTGEATLLTWAWTVDSMILQGQVLMMRCIFLGLNKSRAICSGSQQNKSSLYFARCLFQKVLKFVTDP